MDVIAEMKKGLGFDQVCIVATAQHPTIVVNSKPPLALGTKLKLEAISELVASIVAAIGKPTVVDYHGVWLLALK